MKTWKNIVLASLYALSLGCGSDSGGGFSLGSTDPDAADTTGSTAPLSLTVLSNLRWSDRWITEATCEATAGTPHATCNVVVEELTLYYSNLKFIFGTGSKAYCERVMFTPFRYLRSTDSTFAIGGSSSTLDCSLPTGERDPKCWGGLAPDVVPGFPKNMGIYFLPENGLGTSITAKSSDERRETDEDFSIYTNANTTNNLAAGLRGASLDSSGGDPIDYVGGSYVDNVFECRDVWGNMDYSITLTIRDEDETGGGLVPDEYWDWFD